MQHLGAVGQQVDPEAEVGADLVVQLVHRHVDPGLARRLQLAAEWLPSQCGSQNTPLLGSLRNNGIVPFFREGGADIFKRTVLVVGRQQSGLKWKRAWPGHDSPGAA
jgi:hypothetical protein